MLEHGSSSAHEHPPNVRQNTSREALPPEIKHPARSLRRHPEAPQVGGRQATTTTKPLKPTLWPAPRPLLSHGYSFLLCGGLGDLGADGVLLLDGLDDADGDGLAHVADSEAPQGRVLGEGLHAHGLGGHHDDVGGISVLQELGVGLQLLARPAIDLGGDVRELAGDVGSVTIQHWGIAVSDLPGVVHDDDLQTKIECIEDIELPAAAKVRLPPPPPPPPSPIRNPDQQQFLYYYVTIGNAPPALKGLAAHEQAQYRLSDRDITACVPQSCLQGKHNNLARCL